MLSGFKNQLHYIGLATGNQNLWTKMLLSKRAIATYCICALCLLLIVWPSGATKIVAVENSRVGTDHWLHAQQNPNKKLEIDGFTTKISYFPGDIVHFKMSSASWAESYRMEIYRLGYYNGLGARQVGEIHMTKDTTELKAGRNNTFEIVEQPACLFEEEYRLTDCSNWKNTAEWTLPNDSVSGVYVALPVHDQRKYYGSYIVFVVKKVLKAGVKEDMLFKTADTTWAAYNRYGDYNVYRGGAQAWSKPETRAYKASYNRPPQNRMSPPFGHDSNFIFGAEYPMIYWLEKHGYDVSYCACQDVETMHQDKTILQYKTILSVGHDEYWTPGMKVAHEYARDHGVNLAFFSGNEVFWRSVWDGDTVKSKQLGGSFIKDTASGQTVALDSHRVFVCRKETYDGVASPTPEEWTGTFRDPRFRPADPESLLTGQNFFVNGVRNDAMTVTAGDSEMRLWRNATFAQSHGRRDLFDNVSWIEFDRAHQDRIVYKSAEGLVGYEWDVFPENAERPPGLVPLSTTVIDVKQQLLENFGATYKASGMATHRLSLYRQYNYAPVVADKASADWTAESICSASNAQKTVKPSLLSTSLVFGAGTVQWSWGLYDKHDGPTMAVDRDIQQATLNLFADMGVFPASFVADMTPPLVFPNVNTDVYHPFSSIVGTHQTVVTEGATVGLIAVEVRGRARDDERGDGSVAAVEVSTDGGLTWVMAVGRRHWHHTFTVDIKAAVAANVLTGNSANSANSATSAADATHWLRSTVLGQNGLHCVAKSGEGQSAGKQCSMLILSRAVDDSGWQEEVDALPGLCALQAGQGPIVKQVEGKNIRAADRSSRVHNAHIVEFIT